MEFSVVGNEPDSWVTPMDNRPYDLGG